MIKTRIYHPHDLHIDSEVQLGSQASIHISKVLRMKTGQQILLFNGDGSEYIAEIINPDRRRTRVKILKKSPVNRESSLSVHLGQAISKGEKMDFTIQKAVELGVNSITPLITNRSNVQLKADRMEKRLHHWQGVITSACEQCGRNQIPTLHAPIELDDWLLQTPADALKLTLHPDARQSLRDIHHQDEAVYLLIGPEGGLDREELTLSGKNGFKQISLGPRVLRTESAALTIVSIIQHKWGDI